MSVKGDPSRSKPTTSWPSQRNSRTRASPRSPELPVTRNLTPLVLPDTPTGSSESRRSSNDRPEGFRPRRKLGMSPNEWRCQWPNRPSPQPRMIVAYFIVSDDVERSRRFYTEVLGGTVVFGPEPTNIALANSFIVINAGGGPTDDKPTVTLETPSDPDRVSSFLNIRVTDIHAVYAEWSARGAQFLTPPKQHQYETRCYIRDPDGYIIEVGQTTDPNGDWWPADWPLPNPGGQSG